MPAARSRRGPSGPSAVEIDRRLAGAAPVSFWLDRADLPPASDTLSGVHAADLTVVGGGFSGLWTALLAKRADPTADVVLLEAERIAWAATGRNGGFCDASLTHGELNGRDRFGSEFDRLDQLGRENLDAIAAFVTDHHVDCGWEATGVMTVATSPWQIDGLEPGVDGFLDVGAVRAEVDSPTYLAGRWDTEGCVMIDPAALAWGLRQACLEAGVEIFEQSPVTGLQRAGRAVEVRTAYGQVVSDRVALGTNAFPSLLARVRPLVIPVYDHVLVTEPLTPEQLGRIGWRHRQGLADAGNQFHYYRLTADQRILWGGYEATYHYGKHVSAEYDQDPAVFSLLARQFYDTFPPLADVGFTHRWGGAIDTCSRFCAFFGTAMGGRVAYAAGYTGLGVGATRFGARVMLDLLAGSPTELTELQMVRTKPVPFPPEPLGWAAVQATRWSLARADANEGRRNSWLRLLDHLGLGFDS
jgi:glycine/D-amino acid oxidase-like deaminating enzyme